MAKNLTTQTLKLIVMRLGSSMKSSTYTPQQNGVVERKNRTLITLARTMLDEYNTLEKLWAEAINTACYASNRLFLQKFLGKTPYELLNGKKPDVSFFRVFGCKCYIYKKRQHLGKFQSVVILVFLLATHQSPKHIEYLTMPLVWLKKHMMWNLMNLTAPKEQLRIVMM
jgi:hypothetical protein